VLAVTLVNALLSTPQLSLFLQKHRHLFVGPLLILIAMLLLGLIDLPWGSTTAAMIGYRLEILGGLRALLLSLLFALAFCPTSAALFFGSVMTSLGA
jgi:cytochrome c-type biogenesis protein